MKINTLQFKFILIKYKYQNYSISDVLQGIIFTKG